MRADLIERKNDVATTGAPWRCDFDDVAGRGQISAAPAFTCRKKGNKECSVYRRLSLILCLVVVLDVLFWGLLWYWFGWKVGLIETGVTTVLGLAVIFYYEWRWSEAVAKRLESEPASVDKWSLERILLLVAGLVFLIPGVVTDVLGLLLLMPGVRRTIVNLFQWWG
jgi:UPF0716 family protein affecting phage T7 exclusion